MNFVSILETYGAWIGSAYTLGVLICAGKRFSDLPETLPTVSRLIQAVAVGLSWPIPAATWRWQQILAKKE